MPLLPEAFPVMTGSGQRQPITHRCRSCSWDVFPYDLLPNQLRPVDLLLGQVSNGGSYYAVTSRSLPRYGGEGGPRERWKGHKTYNDVDGRDYQILPEADFLVNADESHMGAAAIRNFRDHVFKTATGTHLLETIYL